MRHCGPHRRSYCSRMPASRIRRNAASVVPGATPATRSSRTVVWQPRRTAASALSSTQWSVASPTILFGN